METLILLGILFVNLIAILLIYQFTKKLPTKEKIIFLVSNFALMYAGVSIAYWFSEMGMDSTINEAAKDVIIFLFVPVNLIILSPFVARKYEKMKTEKGKVRVREFAERLIKIVVIAIIILVAESFYFRTIKNNIAIISSKMKLNDSTSVNGNENILNNDININESVNEIFTETNNVNNINNTSEIKNDLVSNSISNTVDKGNAASSVNSIR